MHSYGTILNFGGVIAQVTTVNIGGISVTAVEQTHLLSADAAKEFIAGLIDAGELSFTINYVKASMASLYALLRTTAAFVVTLPGGSATFSGFGFMTNLGLAVPEDDRITQDITIKITGKPSFA